MDPVTPFQDDLLHSANEPQDHDVSGAVYELQDPNLTMSESDVYGLLSSDMTTLGQVPLASSSVIPGDQSAADLLQDASTISELTSFVTGGGTQLRSCGSHDQTAPVFQSPSCVRPTPGYPIPATHHGKCCRPHSDSRRFSRLRRDKQRENDAEKQIPITQRTDKQRFMLIRHRLSFQKI
jgi:hypothetical protein